MKVPTYATTSRSAASGVTVVLDTCIHGPAKVIDPEGPMMTNSAKWAYYAPAHLGYDVVLAGRRDCVESAVRGTIVLESAHG